MPEIQKFDLNQVGGSLNEGDPGSSIEDVEAQVLLNFYPTGKIWRRRKGVTPVTATPFGEALNSLVAYKQSVGDWDLIVGAPTQFGKLSGAGVAAIPHVDSVSFLSNNFPWKFKQYKDRVYAARVDAGTIKVIDGSVVADSGIPGPVVAVSGVEGSAGNLEGGDYQYVISFFNTETGAESDFSPVSATVTIAADKRINLTGIPTSLNFQVNARRIYRTLVNQEGEFFFVAQINDNITTTFEDNIDELNLAEAVSLDNGLPPGSVKFIEVWRERLFATDGRDLFASRIALPEQFAEDFFIPVFPDDGHEMRGVLAAGDRLLLGKTNKVHYLVGTDESDFEVHTLTDTHGVAAGHSMQMAEGIARWYSGDDFYQSDGTSISVFGDKKIRNSLDSVLDTEKERVVSWVYPALGWYITSFPDSGFILGYDYRAGAWFRVEHNMLAGAPVYAGEFFDTNYGRVLYCVFDDGHIYQWHKGTTDDGSPIICRLRGKSLSFNTPGLLKAVRRVHVLSPSVAETLTARLYRDGNAAAISERTGISWNQQRHMKRIGISNVRDLGTEIAFELEYQGQPEIEIQAMSFDVGIWRRAPREI